MKLRYWGAVLTVIALASPARADRWTAIEQLPDATPVQVRVRDKDRAYFRLTPERPLAVPVVGPAQVRLTTRVVLPPGSHAIATYQVRITEGLRAVNQISTESSAAESVSVTGSSNSIGKSRALTFDVPAGTHRLGLALSGAGAVLVRIQRNSAGGDAQMVSLTPISAVRSVSVAEGEKTIPYYTVLPRHPVAVRVVGPTMLEVLTRLDFDDTMRGIAIYRMRLSEKGRTLNETEFKTTKATTATYTNLQNRVPSKFDRTRIEIPAGLHEISIEMVQPLRGSAEIHARIPQPSVGNQE